jgi:beta-phosphoglucomutase
VSGVPVRAVIFDFNGVIVDDEPIHMRLYREVLAEEGAPITEREYRERYLGMDDRGIFAAALRDRGLGERAAADGYVAALVERKAGRYLRAIEREARPVAGAIDLVRACAARTAGRIAVVSGALRQEIDAVLRAFEVRDLFPVVIAQDDMTHGKPDPEGFLRGLAALGRLEPIGLAAREVAVIEDSVPGVIAARRAGMRCLGVTTSCPADALRRAGAGRVVATLEALDPATLDLLPEA